MKHAGLRRHAFGERGRRHGRALVRAEHLLRGALEDLLAGEHAIEDAAERVEVRRRADERRLLADLLGRDPADGAGARVHRELGLGRAVETRVVTRLAEPREAEVEDVRARPRPVDARSSITFDGLRSPWMMCARVRVAEAREHLIDERPDHRPRHRGRVHPLVDAASRQRVHHEVRRAVVRASRSRARARSRGARAPRRRAPPAGTTSSPRRASAFASSGGRRRFSATRSCVTRSLQRYTTPMPPRPSSRRTS